MALFQSETMQMTADRSDVAAFADFKQHKVVLRQNGQPISNFPWKNRSAVKQQCLRTKFGRNTYDHSACHVQSYWTVNLMLLFSKLKAGPCTLSE